MRLPDVISGLLILALGSTALIWALTFPPPIGQPLGPAVFPIVISSVLVVASLLLIVSSIVKSSRSTATPKAADVQAPLDLITWAIMGVIIALPVFYMLTEEQLGFLLSAFIVLFVANIILWGGLARSAAVSVLSAIILDGVFRGVFGIPLDTGLLYIPWW